MGSDAFNLFEFSRDENTAYPRLEKGIDFGLGMVYFAYVIGYFEGVANHRFLMIISGLMSG